MKNNKQLLSVLEIVSLGAIFDGVEFSTKQSQAQCFVKCCIQRPAFMGHS